MRTPMLKPLAAATLIIGLAGCSFAPTYHQPKMPVSASFKEATGAWKMASPSDQFDRGQWWKVFNDPQLSALEERLEKANPTLAGALASYDGARAYASEIRSGLFPSLGVGSDILNQRQSDFRPLRDASSTYPDEYQNHDLTFNLNYEVDLWGKIRNEVAAGRGDAQASSADLANIRLSLQSQLANYYMQLRGFDIQQQILTDSLNVYERGLQLTEALHAGGAVSGLDVARAQTQLADSRSLLDQIKGQRALTEHAIAALVGTTPSEFSIALTGKDLTVPVTPVGVPSTLLERRPDIAAAERRTFAANAQIGVARAAYFPTLSLTGGFGWQNTGHNDLLAMGNRYWALGPISALNLFDGGYRRGKVREAHADFEMAAATYRQTVLTAIRQVEDNLSLLDHLGSAADDEQQAVTSALKSQSIATNRYREGAVSYLDVVTAQANALSVELNAQAIRTSRLQASVNLIRALGGGWERSDMPRMSQASAPHPKPNKPDQKI
ncbi:efflux transporter outer membrane subunit [Frateuria aurantia]